MVITVVRVPKEMLVEMKRMVDMGLYPSVSQLVRAAVADLIRTAKAGAGTEKPSRRAFKLKVLAGLVAREIMRSQPNDGAVVYTTEDVRRVLETMGATGVRLVTLVPMINARIRAAGFRKVGQFTLRGVRYHIFVKTDPPQRVLKLMELGQARKRRHAVVGERFDYLDVADLVVRKILERPSDYLLNVKHGGTLVLKKSALASILRQLAEENAKVRRWLDQVRSVPNPYIYWAIEHKLRMLGYSVRRVSRGWSTALIISMDGAQPQGSQPPQRGGAA